MRRVRIAILGAGAGGMTMAGDLAPRGFEVHLWGRNPWRLAPVLQHRQVRLRGLIDGDIQLAGVSLDISDVVRQADLVFVPLPGFAQREVAELCAPHVRDGQTIVTCAHAGMGSVLFARVFRDLHVTKDIVFGEMVSLPYGGRFMEAGVVNTITGLTQFFVVV